jgi:hypothetical protein
MRVALLALWAGGDRSLAEDFLGRSAAKKVESWSDTREALDHTQTVPLARWYRSLRSLASETVRKAELQAIRRVTDALPGAASMKPRHRSSTKKKQTAT